jgi:hypothetical protein
MLLPNWALEKAGPNDRVRSKAAYQQKTGRFTVPNRVSLKDWMLARGWKRSWLSPEGSFYKQCFQDDVLFQLALKDQMIDIWIPKAMHQVSAANLAAIDEDYQQKDWSAAVAQLRDIRRAIDAGITIELDGQTFISSGAFYTWAHQRYHVLEEISNDWMMDG